MASSGTSTNNKIAGNLNTKKNKIQLTEGAGVSRVAGRADRQPRPVDKHRLQADSLGLNRLHLCVSFHFFLICVMGIIPPCRIVVVRIRESNISEVPRSI